MDATPEIWRDVIGHRGYQVSNLGRVRSSKIHGWRGGDGDEWRIINGSVGKNGYRYIAVTGRKKRYVHRLVAEAFLGSPPSGAEVAHWDGVRTNNQATNLRWSTAAENSADKIRHGTTNRGMQSKSRKLTQDEVDQIRARYGDRNGRRFGRESQYALAREFRVSQQRISAIVNYKTWQYRV